MHRAADRHETDDNGHFQPVPPDPPDLELKITAGNLETIERQLTALLYAIWRTRGIDKRIVKVKANE